MTASLTHGARGPRALAAIAAAGLAGLALTACTPHEYPTSEPGTTPPVVTGNQVIPGDLVNADGIPAEPGSAVGTVALASAEGDSVGAASFVADGSRAKMNLRVSGLAQGQHGVEVRSGTNCDAPNDFSSTGNAIAGGSLPGISVGPEGNGSANQTVAVNIGDLDGKAMVLLDDSSPIACGIIMAN